MAKSKKQTKNARRFGRVAALLGTMAVASCITVNVNFPESAVQRAADDFVTGLYKSPAPVADASGDAAAASKAVKNAVKKPAKIKAKAAAPTTWYPSGLQMGFALVFADEEPSLVINTPKANSLRAGMAARGKDILAWSEKGAICESKDGTLMMADASKAGAQASEVNKLIKDENNARESLYDEVASANQINARNHQQRMRQIFAGAFARENPHPCH